MNIDLKMNLVTPDGATRILVVTINPFTVAITKEVAVRVEEAGDGGSIKMLGKTDLKLGNLLKLAKSVGEQ